MWRHASLLLVAYFAATAALAQVPPPDPLPAPPAPSQSPTDKASPPLSAPPSAPPAAAVTPPAPSTSVTIPLTPPPSAEPGASVPLAPMSEPAKAETPVPLDATAAAPKPKTAKAKPKPKLVPAEPKNQDVEEEASSGKPPSFRCFVRDVMAFYDRTHVRCYNKARGKIIFFAVDTGQPIAATVLSKALNAIQLGKPITISYAPGADLNPTNCDAANCRRLIDIKN